MTMNPFSGVSRVLDPTAREFREVILQQGKPPMDAEFNLLQEMTLDVARRGVLSGMPSGWLGNETNLPADYQTNPAWSNWFRFGTQRAGEKQSVMYANVNGWVIPVTGTRTGTPPGSPNDTDTTNIIALDPPPANSGDQRADFVFLEVWQARVAPNPSTTNKPNSTSLYRYGNVEGGYTFLPDDLVDPSLGFETSQRIQLQYRVRVVKGPVGLANYPDGFDPSYVKGKGAYDPAHPDTQTAFTFQNMRQELGDPGLWRAGDGTQNNLGTADGYVYAIPLCAVFRRNTVEWLGEDNPNLNGAVNRNPTATDRTGVKTFTVTPTLASAMTLTSTTISLVAAAGTPLPASSLTPVYVQIGDEILTYQGITGNTLNNVLRGQAGTVAEVHPAGSVVRILSSRPDGLFADQVALTDILDLRHVVNPNGFKYDTLLRYNFDKLLRGELRSNWKRSNGGTQGVFVNYQDMVSQDTASLSVTQLDRPDGYRMVFSDAVTAQPFEAIVQPVLGTAPVDYTVSWSLGLTVQRTAPSVKADLNFANGDQLTIPIGQLKNSLGPDVDQVRWCDEGSYRVELRLDGEPEPINTKFYTVTPTGSSLTTNDDLVITLGAPGYPFPTVTGRNLYVKVWALYGAGRGAARIADAVHSVTLRSPQSNILYRLPQYPANNYRTNTGFAPLWSRFANVPLPGVRAPLPVTAESYVDPGSRTLILQPFQRISWPNSVLTLDGTAANISTGAAVLSRSSGVSNGSTTFTDSGADYTTSGVTAGMALVITDLDTMLAGRYSIMAVVDATTLTLDRPLLVNQGAIAYSIYPAQGLMPTKKRDGVTAKWTTTDPLGLFSGSTDTPHPTTKNMYINLPAHLVPKAGEFHVPIRAIDAAPFAEGINFMFASGKGSTYSDADRNVVPYLNGTVSYAVFSTLNLNPPFTNPAAYNDVFTVAGKTFAGIRKFTDTRGLGRQGLELPPFYGISRLFGVYEANDYRVNQGPYNTTTRDRLASGGAVNLLRQDVQGPTFWIEVDEDGDATFILNAECLDLSRSPNPIANFAAGQYVIEASIFGFDRDAFNDPPTPTTTFGPREVRIVLTRFVSGSSAMRTQAADQTPGNRAANITVSINGPVSVLPGPLGSGDTALYNYSRTPYGGDAWGTQRPNTDIDRLAGPLTSGDAYQLATTKPDITNLTRPNEKTFEVLASLPFVTSVGTGRIAGTASSSNPVQSAGYEDVTNYPPASPLAPRPNFFSYAMSGGPLYQSRYNGLTERLPLGALRRDHDFRAALISSYSRSHTEVGGPNTGVGSFAGMAVQTNQEAVNLIRLADCTIEPGAVVVHVDGSNFDSAAPFRNFRTNRGGSGYMANGDNPGGWISPGVVGTMDPTNGTQVMLAGVAYLVRNTITTKGGNEVSAGDELMMLVATQYQPTFGNFSAPPAVVSFSTVGVGEGDAALDYYRIEGHPLVRDNVGAEVNPSTIQLAGP